MTIFDFSSFSGQHGDAVVSAAWVPVQLGAFLFSPCLHGLSPGFLPQSKNSVSGLVRVHRGHCAISGVSIVKRDPYNLFVMYPEIPLHCWSIPRGMVRAGWS